MSNINFLSNSKDEKGSKKEENEEIKWSKPDISLDTKKEEKKKPKKKFFGLFSKKKKVKKEDKPVLGSKIKEEKPLIPVKERPALVSPVPTQKTIINNDLKIQPTSEKEDISIVPKKDNADASNAPIPSKDKNNNKNITANGGVGSMEWKNPEILGTNLIKNEIVSFFDWKKNIAILLVFVLLSCAAMGVSYAWLVSWGDEKKEEAKLFAIEFDKLKQKVENAEEEAEDAVVFKEKLKLASILLDKHIYWSNFFKFLEKNTIGDVYYTGGFSGNRNGKYSMSSKTISFNVVSEQVKALRKNELVIDANVSSGEFKAGSKEEDEEVGFTLNFTVDTSIFTADPSTFEK